MMTRWGLEGMGSFESAQVLRKEIGGCCTPDLAPAVDVDVEVPEKRVATEELKANVA